MARYIDVDKLAETIKYYYEHTGDQSTNAEHYAYGVALKEIEKLPTADVEEVKHGEWKNVAVYNGICIATCSNCRQQIVEIECNATVFKFENAFCRKCGAKMEGGKANDL